MLWINLVRDWVQVWAVVDMAINCRFPQNGAGNLLAKQATISLVRTLSYRFKINQRHYEGCGISFKEFTFISNYRKKKCGY